MKEKLKVGVIGAGAIVESNHIPVLKILPGVTVEWIYDRDISRSELISKMFHVPYVDGKNIETNIIGVDVCLLTIPYGARKDYIELCASKNKALYVEKPFAVSIKEHSYYCSLFPPEKLAVGFQRRYYAVVELLRSIVAGNLFGQLKAIHFNQGYFTLKGGKEFLSNATLSGGGVIIESAIHTIDQLLMITGAESSTVNQLSSLQVKGIDYDSIFESKLNCKTGSINVSVEVSTLRNLDNGVRFTFDHAVVYCGMAPNEELRIFDVEGNPMRLDMRLFNMDSLEQKLATSVSAAFYFFWIDFLSAIRSGIPNKTSAISSLPTTKWIHQIYEKINQIQ